MRIFAGIPQGGGSSKRKTVRDTTKVTTCDQREVAYALSIGTKVDDLG